MVNVYAQVEDIADFLRIPIDATTIPNTTQIEKLIDRAQDKLDRRTGHAWRLRTVTQEQHDLPLLYRFGWGTMISLHHRMVYDLDTNEGDVLEIWGGSTGQYSDITLNNAVWEEKPNMGEIFLRGFLFSILRANRIRITYRFGGEPGDTFNNIAVPADVEEATVKLVAIDLLTSSLRMDQLPMGNSAIDINDSITRWQADVDRIIRNREEFHVVTT